MSWDTYVKKEGVEVAGKQKELNLVVDTGDNKTLRISSSVSQFLFVFESRA